MQSNGLVYFHKYLHRFKYLFRRVGGNYEAVVLV